MIHKAMDAFQEITNETFKDIVNGTNSVLHDPAHKSSLQRFLFSYDSVNKVYTPILFLFGAIGNCLSVTVFCTAPSHRHLSSSFYLSALAISDIGYLLNLLAVWLEDMGLHVITSPITCPTVMFLGQVTCFLSVWLTVSFTVERFFAVCYPLTRQTICTVARAKKVITVLSLVALVSFSYVWLIAIVVDFPLASTTSTMLQQQQENDEDFDMDGHGSGSGNGNDNGNGDGNGAAVETSLGFDFGPGPGSASELMDGGGNVGHVRGRLMNSSMAWNDCLPWGLAHGEKIGTFSQFDVICNGSDQLLRTATGTVLGGSGGNRNWTMESGETMRVCYVREEYMYLSSIASHMDSVLTLILPFLIITYLNIRIALTVWKLKDQRQSIVALAKMSSANVNGAGRDAKKNHLSSAMTACRIPGSPSSSNTPVLLLNGGGLGSTSNLNASGGGGKSSNTSNSQHAQKAHLNLNMNISRSSFSSPDSSSNTTNANANTNTNTNKLRSQSQPQNLSQLCQTTPANSYRINLGSSASLSNPGGICNSTNVNGPGLNQLRTQRNHHSPSTSAAEARVTKTLLLVSTVFLVLNLPAHAIRAVAYIQSWWGLTMVASEEIQALQQWANILFNTNFSVNFLLYCVSGRNFRKSLWGICFNRKSRRPAKRSKRTILNIPGTRPPLDSLNHQSSFSNKARNKIVVVTSGPDEDFGEKNLNPNLNQPT